MELQQSRRRKQEKPRQLNNTSEDEMTDPPSTIRQSSLHNSRLDLNTINFSSKTMLPNIVNDYIDVSKNNDKISSNYEQCFTSDFHISSHLQNNISAKNKLRFDSHPTINSSTPKCFNQTNNKTTFEEKIGTLTAEYRERTRVTSTPSQHYFSSGIESVSHPVNCIPYLKRDENAITNTQPAENLSNYDRRLTNQNAPSPKNQNLQTFQAKNSKTISIDNIMHTAGKNIFLTSSITSNLNLSKKYDKMNDKMIERTEEVGDVTDHTLYNNKNNNNSPDRNTNNVFNNGSDEGFKDDHNNVYYYNGNDDGNNLSDNGNGKIAETKGTDDKAPKNDNDADDGDEYTIKGNTESIKANRIDNLFGLNTKDNYNKNKLKNNKTDRNPNDNPLMVLNLIKPNTSLLNGVKQGNSLQHQMVFNTQNSDQNSNDISTEEIKNSDKNTMKSRLIRQYNDQQVTANIESKNDFKVLKNNLQPHMCEDPQDQKNPASNEESDENSNEHTKNNNRDEDPETDVEDCEHENNDFSSSKNEFLKQDKLPDINTQHLNSVLLRLQQQQIMQFQMLESIRKKILENKKTNNENDESLMALFLHHQQEIAHLYSTYQQTLAFFNRQETTKQITNHNQHLLAYQEYIKNIANRSNEDIEEQNGEKHRDLEEEGMDEDGAGKYVATRKLKRTIEFNGREASTKHPKVDVVSKRESFEMSDGKEESEEKYILPETGHVSGNSNSNNEHLNSGREFEDEKVDNYHGRAHKIEESEDENRNGKSINNANLNTDEWFESKIYDLSTRNNNSADNRKEIDANSMISKMFSKSPSTILNDDLIKSQYITSFPESSENFNSPLMALSSMSSSLKFNKTPINMLFPGDSTTNVSNPFSQFSSYRFNKPTPFVKSAMLNTTNHDDPLEQFMEIQMTENSKMEELIKEKESKISDPNECAICHRVLSCRSALQMHYRTHTGERPYKCKLCSRTFTTKGNLKTHMSIHRGKTFQRQLQKCLICSREFSNPLVLQQHFKSHISDLQNHPVFPFGNMINSALYLPSTNPFLSYPPSFLTLSQQLSTKNFDVPRAFMDLSNQAKKHAQTYGNSLHQLKLNDGIKVEDDQKNEHHNENSSDFDKSSNIDDFITPTSVETTIKVENQQTNSFVESFKMSSNKSTSEEPQKIKEEKLENDAKHSPREQQLNFDDAYSQPIQNELDFDDSKNNDSRYISPLDALTDRVNSLNRSSPSKLAPSPLAALTNLMKERNESQFFVNPNLNVRQFDQNRIYAQNLIKNISDVKSTPQSQATFQASNNLSKASAACNVCGKMFSCKSAVDIHMRSHTKERPFRCSYCDRAFTTKGNLKQHVGTNHHNLSKLNDLSNKNNYLSDSSISSKSASPFVYSISNENSQISSPKVKQENQNLKDFSKNSKTNLGSKEPSKPVTQNVTQRETKPEKPQENFKVNPNNSRYFCNTCEKPFSSTSALQIHSRTHTGDRPFVCPTCNKAFTTKGNLKVHMGTHAWNKVPSRRGRRMSVDPLASPLNRSSDKQSHYPLNPKITSPQNRFSYNFLRFPFLQPKISEAAKNNLMLSAFHNNRMPFQHPLHSFLFDKYQPFNSFLQQQQKRFLFNNNMSNNFLANKDSVVSNLTTPIKQEKSQMDAELDLSIKRPTSSSPHSLEGSKDWKDKLGSDRLVFDCR